MKGIKKKISDHDMFGHMIPINFNRKGASHNTLIGGFFSVLIKTGMVYFIIINVIKLVTFTGDSISTTVRRIEHSYASEPLFYNGKDQLLFWTLTKAGKGRYDSLYLNDTHFKEDAVKKIKPYLKVKFLQEDVDWHKYLTPQ